MIELAFTLALARFRVHLETVLRGSVAAIMGPSGAGKTSLLEAVAGLRPAARGRIVVDGAVFLDTAAGVSLPPERRRVGYVPQDAGLFPHLTVLENVQFGARRDQTHIDTAVAILGLAPLLSRYPATLSGGEKQRVALARALATGPRVLLLDEPLAAVDVELRERVLPYLLRIRAEWRVPILYVTHNVGEALAVADTVLLLRDGALQAAGAPAELLSSTFVAEEAAGVIENLLPAEVVAHDDVGGVTRVTLAAGPVLTIPLAGTLAPRATILLAVRAEDVLVALEPPRALSARNVLEARVLTVEHVAADVLLRCSIADAAQPWVVRLTRAAVASLGLTAGARVWLAVKSHSIRVV